MMPWTCSIRSSLLMPNSADARDDRLQEEVPPQDQQLHRDPGDQQQAGQVPGGQGGPGTRADQRGRGELRDGHPRSAARRRAAPTR
jgi:hypothetical protein